MSFLSAALLQNEEQWCELGSQRVPNTNIEVGSNEIVTICDCAHKPHPEDGPFLRRSAGTQGSHVMHDGKQRQSESFEWTVALIDFVFARKQLPVPWIKRC